MKAYLTLDKIPLRNLRRHPVRTAVLLLLALAEAACVFGGLTMTGVMRQEMAAAEMRLGADILVYPSAAMSKISGKSLLMQGTPAAVWRDRSTLSRLQDCDGLEKITYQVYIQDSTGETPVWIAGFDPETDFAILPWMEDPKEDTPPDGAVLAGCRVSAPGDAVTLFGRSWPAAGRLMETGSPLDEMVFVNLHTLESLITAAAEAGVTAYGAVDPQRDYSAALVKVQNKNDVESITNWINVYVRKVKAVRSEETLTDTAAGVRGQITLIAVIAAGAWLLLLLALGIAQGMMMKERKKELFVWQTVGACGGTVRRIMLTEALLVHSAGAVLGTALAALLCLPFKAAFSIPFALLTVCLTAAAGCVSTAVSLRRTAAAPGGQTLTV